MTSLQSENNFQHVFAQRLRERLLRSLGMKTRCTGEEAGGCQPITTSTCRVMETEEALLLPNFAQGPGPVIF